MQHQPLSILFLSSYITRDFGKDNLSALYIDTIKKHSGHQIDFVKDDKKIYDATLIFNTVIGDEKINTIAGNVFALMQEPGENVYFNPFMFSGLDQFDKVFSPLVNSQNMVQSIPYLGWFIQMSYEELLHLDIPRKDKLLSCMMSNEYKLIGHKKRFNFMKNHLRMSDIEIDFYGRNINFIEKKEDALLNYKYSITIENSSKEFYFTEKISDCFLCYTVPFYYGCTNIDKFFPKQSYVHIDIDNPQKAMDSIREELASDRYKERIPYLQEARELVLKKYNVIGWIKELEPIMYANKKKGEVKEYSFHRVYEPLYEKSIKRGRYLPKDIMLLFEEKTQTSTISWSKMFRFVLKCLICKKIKKTDY